MNEWSEGYNADISYTYGYFPEFNPLRAQWLLLNAGIAPPAWPATGGAACELGFGQGVSVAVHAAGSNVQWWGTDFMPEQAAYAMDMVRASGTEAHLYDQAFSEFCKRDDLPQFDSIGMHGIWSWVSEENRNTIVDFLRRKLKPGGVLYVSYNTQPGWSSGMPLRHLLTSHAAAMGTQGQGVIARIDEAVKFANRLMDVNPGYLRANPAVRDRLERLATLDKTYLAHEYFNREWEPMHFAQMVERLAPAKLSYACSALMLDNIDGLNLPAEQLKFVNDIPRGTFRETVRDFCVNQQFRRDYWIKGARQLNPIEQHEAILAQRVVMVVPAAAISLKVNGASGEISLRPDIYKPLVALLADHVPRTVEEVLAGVSGGPVGFAAVREAITVMIGMGVVQLCQSDAAASSAKPRTDRLNAFLCDQARTGGISYLASPLVGGHAVNRRQQLFMLARNSGLRTPGEWAQYAWSQLSQMGQRLTKHGVTLMSAQENLTELELQAQDFMSARLPILKALKIA